MRITKCDVCKKIISSGAESYDLARNGKLKFASFEICFDCGGPLLKFLEDKKLIKDKNK